LEGRFEILLVNAFHIKQVPGRKTDVKDCEWIAQLLQHGLLKASFIPPAAVRELRDLTRQRAQLAGEKAAVANRIQKVLEEANIKLGSVATDVLGESGRDMIRALIAGENDPEKLADLARKRLRAKIPALRLALHGRVTPHHRFLLQLHCDHLESLERLIARLTEQIDQAMKPYQEAAERLAVIPGIGPQAAEVVVAEMGIDMTPFPTSTQVTAWAGICPGNNESAGKHRSGRTPKGNRWLKRTLAQAAWAASHTKHTYLAAQYRRLAARRGRKRALIAVAHSLLVIIYHMLKGGTTFQELGPDYLDRLSSERLTRQLVRRLESLGHTVKLEPPGSPALQTSPG
jgi:transposase